jgi:predicted RND superfamily exporter protein
MEELEDPTEKLKEIQELAEERREERWTMDVSLSTAIIAVLAAIAGLMGNHHSNEALLERVKASDQWSYYEAKSIKSEISVANAEVLQAMGKQQQNVKDAATYEQEKKDIQKTAKELEESSEAHLHHHIVFSFAVTIFQVAIAISAIAILTRRKFMWYLSLLLAAAASVFLVLGFL